MTHLTLSLLRDFSNLSVTENPESKEKYSKGVSEELKTPIPF